MSYLVIARKYRPSVFEEVVGQEAVARTLKNAVASDRVAHAYLFAGPRGVGKTSMARILSKALNCEKGPTPAPCGVCPNCESITRGSDLDVQEIDGASNRGIDEVRAVRENAYYQSSRSRFRIYIIDEVHMLTTQAFNALLKILEEPPHHVKFIFATTQPQSIPDTIRSRCQRFDFKAITAEEIAARLGEIAKAEKVGADPEALQVIARRAKGGMRDAQSLLDQAFALGKKKITVDDVRFLLGWASTDELLALARTLAAGDAPALLEQTGRLLDSGQDPGEFVGQLIEVARDMLVLNACSGKPPVPLSSGADPARLNELASSFERDDLLYMVQLLTETRRKLSRDVEGRILLEAALLRLVSLKDLEPIGKAFARLEAAAPGARTQAPGPPEEGAKKPRWTPPPAPEQRPPAPAGPLPAPAGSSPPEKLFAAFLEALQEKKKQLAAYLREGRLSESSTDAWKIGFPLDRGFHKERVQEEATRTWLEEILKGVAGRPIRLEFFTLGEQVGKVIEGLRDDPDAPGRTPEQGDEPPIVSKAKRVFKGRIVND